MEGRVTYSEKAAVPSVNEVEIPAGKPGAGGNVVNLEIDVLRRGPRGNRNYIGISECTSVVWYVTLHAPISSALNLT